MKLFLKIPLILLSILSCTTLKQTTDNDCYKIDAIDNNLIANYHCIYLRKDGKKCLLISRKNESIVCQNAVKESDCIFGPLKKIYKIELDSSLSWPMYRSDFYIDGKKVLDRELEVYVSIRLKGLCQEP